MKQKGHFDIEKRKSLILGQVKYVWVCRKGPYRTIREAAKAARARNKAEGLPAYED